MRHTNERHQYKRLVRTVKCKWQDREQTLKLIRRARSLRARLLGSGGNLSRCPYLLVIALGAGTFDKSSSGTTGQGAIASRLGHYWKWGPPDLPQARTDGRPLARLEVSKRATRLLLYQGTRLHAPRANAVSDRGLAHSHLFTGRIRRLRPLVSDWCLLIYLSLTYS